VRFLVRKIRGQGVRRREETDGGRPCRAVCGAVASLVISVRTGLAIGTGRNATPEQANEMCGYIRKVIEDLYGDEVSEKVIIPYAAASNRTTLPN
jgi:triosephosphate isomerase